MSGQMIIDQCAPTLLNRKTGNLFSCPYDDLCMLEEEVGWFNDELSLKGISVILAQIKNKYALVYLYRPKRLCADIKNPSYRNILHDCGYKKEDTISCIDELKVHLKKGKEFPHEIGLFLGYPPEDVKAFIEHRDQGCKCSGCWRVYGNMDRSLKCFQIYRECTTYCQKQYAKGKTLSELTVSD